MGSSSDEKRRRARKIRRNEVNEKKIALVKTFRKLQGAIEDLARTAMSQKRSHSSSSSSSSSSSATSSSSSASSTTTSGSSTSSASSSDKRNRRHRRVSEESRSRSRHRRCEKYKNGGATSSQSKFSMKSRQKDANSKKTERDERDSRKKRKIDYSRHEESRKSIEACKNDSEREKNQSEPGTSGLAAKLRSCDRRSFSDDSRKRQTERRDESRKNDGKENGDKAVKKDDDRDRHVSCRQKPKFSRRLYQNCQKVKESRSVNKDDDTQAAHFVDDRVGKKPQEEVEIVSEILNDKDDDLQDGREEIAKEKRKQNIEIVNNDSMVLNDDPHCEVDDNRKGNGNEEKDEKIVKIKEAAVKIDATISGEQTAKTDSQDKNIKRILTEDESSNDFSMDLLAICLSPQSTDVYDTDDNNDGTTNERKIPEEKVNEVFATEVRHEVDKKHKKTETTLKEDDALTLDDKILKKKEKDTNVVVASSNMETEINFLDNNTDDKLPSAEKNSTEEKSVDCKKVDTDEEEKNKKEENFKDVETSNEEKNQTQKLKEDSDYSVSKVEENQRKNYEKSLQKCEPMIIEESSSCDDDEEDSEDSEDDLSEENTLEAKKDMCENVSYKSLLHKMCVGFLALKSDEDRREVLKATAEVITDSKNDSTIKNVTKNVSGKNEENVFTEETATTSGLQILSIVHQIIENDSPKSEENISQTKLVTILATAKEPSVAPKFPEESEKEFYSQETENTDDKETPIILESPAEVAQKFASKETTNIIEKEPPVAPKFPAELEEVALQETKDLTEKEPHMALKLSAKSAEELTLREIEILAEKEPPMAPKLPAESVEELALREIEILAEKEPPMAPKLPAESAEELALREIEILAEKEPLVAPKLPAESIEEFPLQETANLAEEEPLVAPKLLAESIEEFPVQETANPAEEEPPMAPILPAESVEEFALQKAESLAEYEPLVALKLPAELVEEFTLRETTNLTKEESPLAPILSVETAEELAVKEAESLGGNEPPVAPKLPAESVEEFPSQETANVAEEEPPMAPKLPAESAEEFALPETTNLAEKEPPMAPILPVESAVEFALQDAENLAEKEPLVAPELPAESAKGFTPCSMEIDHFADIESMEVEVSTTETTKNSFLHKMEEKIVENVPAAISVVEINTTDHQEKLFTQTDKKGPMLSAVDKILTLAVKKFDASRRKDLTEKELPTESLEEFSSQETKDIAENELPTESLEKITSQESKDLAEKEPPMAPDLPEELSEDFLLLQSEDFAKKAPLVAPELSEEIQPQEIEVFTKKESPMAPEYLTKLSEDIRSQEVEVFKTKTVEKFPVQKTENLAEKEPQMAPKFPSKSSEESSQKIVILADKETPVAPELPAESQEELLSQKTQTLDGKEPSVTPCLSAESSQEFLLQETESFAEKKSVMALESPSESWQKVSSQKAEDFAEKEPRMVPNLPAESAEEIRSNKIEKFAEKESPMSADFLEESSQETDIFAAKEPLLSNKLPAESSEEFSSQETESFTEEEPLLVPEFPQDSSQQFFSRETENLATKEPPVTPKLPEESSDEFSSQEIENLAEKVPLIISEFPAEPLREFPLRETESLAAKEPSVAPKLPGQFSAEFSPRKTESLSEKDEPVSLELPTELTPDFPSQDTDNLYEVTPMEVDTSDGSDTENNSNDSSTTIISKVEAEREDHDFRVESYGSENLTISANSNLQDESAKKFPESKNILPVIKEMIKIDQKENDNASKIEVSNAQKSEVHNRSKQKIVDECRSLHSRNVCKLRKNLKRSLSAPIDIQFMLEITKNSAEKREIGSPIDSSLKKLITPIDTQFLSKSTENPAENREIGSPIDSSLTKLIMPIDTQELPKSTENSAENREIGSTIDSSLANDWTTIMRRGLSKETKEQLIAKHPPAANCPALKAPLLRENWRHLIHPMILQKDRQLVSSQNQLTAAISAIGKVLSIIQKENVAPETVRTLDEAGKILADLHHENVLARRSHITPEIGNIVENVVGKNVVDRLLFEGNDFENFGENRAPISGREIEMRNTEEKSEKDDESDSEFLANFSEIGEVASLISNDDSAGEISDTDFFGYFSNSDNGDSDFEEKSTGEKIGNSKTGSDDFSETIGAKETQPEVTQTIKASISSKEIQKSVEHFGTDNNDQKIVFAAPKKTEIQSSISSSDPEAETSDATDFRSATSSDNKDIGMEQKSAKEKICDSQNVAEDLSDIIAAKKSQPEVTDAIKISVSSIETQKFAIDKNDRKIVFVAPKTTETLSSTSSNDSVAIKPQSATSGIIKPSFFANEAEKSVKTLKEPEAIEKPIFERKNVTTESEERFLEKKLQQLSDRTKKSAITSRNVEKSKIALEAQKSKSSDSNLTNLFGNLSPSGSQGNRSNKKPEQTDSPRSSKIVIKSVTLVKSPQKLSIVSGFPCKSVSFASPTIPSQGQQRQGTPWKIHSVKKSFIVAPSTTPSQAKNQDVGSRKISATDLLAPSWPEKIPKEETSFSPLKNHDRVLISSSKNPNSSGKSFLGENAQPIISSTRPRSSFSSPKKFEKSSSSAWRENDPEKSLSKDSRNFCGENKIAWRSPSKEILSQSSQKRAREFLEKDEKMYQGSVAWYREKRQRSSAGKPETLTISQRNVEDSEKKDFRTATKLRVPREKNFSCGGIELEKIENRDSPAPRQYGRAEIRSSCEIKLEKNDKRDSKMSEESQRPEKISSTESKLEKIENRNSPAPREYRRAEIRSSYDKNENFHFKTPQESHQIEKNPSAGTKLEKMENRDFKVPRVFGKVEKLPSCKIQLEKLEKVDFKAPRDPKRKITLSSEIAPKNVDKTAENVEEKSERLRRGNINVLQWFERRRRIAGATDTEITPYREIKYSATSGAQDNSAKNSSATFSDDKIID